VKPAVSSSAVVELLVALVAVGVVLSVGLARDAELAALVGVAVSTLFGLGALLQKARSATDLPEGPAGLKALMSVQVLTLGLRLVAVLVGGLAMKRFGLEPIAYVLAFFACYVVQQFVEMRFVLEASKARHPVEARS
jgi:hypothetical protein